MEMRIKPRAWKYMTVKQRLIALHFSVNKKTVQSLERLNS